MSDIEIRGLPIESAPIFLIQAHENFPIRNGYLAVLVAGVLNKPLIECFQVWEFLRSIDDLTMKPFRRRNDGDFKLKYFEGDWELILTKGK